MRAGFPHSEILGSKPVCGLPGAYRTLQRPSSPVIAKASTTCTCSLDPITAKPSNVAVLEPVATGSSQRLYASSLRTTTTCNEHGRDNHSIPCPILGRPGNWTSSEFLKNNSRRKTSLWPKRPEGNAAPALASGVSRATRAQRAASFGVWWR